jgi:hypothetical protein
MEAMQKPGYTMHPIEKVQNGPGYISPITAHAAELQHEPASH